MKNLVLIFILSSLCGITYSQDLPKSWDKVDLDLLNQLCIDEVNILRKKKRKSKLEINERVKPACYDHSNFMAEKDKLTHYQKGKKKNPWDRTAFFNCNVSYTAENIQYITLWDDVPSNGFTTYQELAKELVNEWRTSPPHYKNLMTKDIEGIYHSFSVANEKLYVCQLLVRD